MPINDHVVSLELAKQLKEAGYPQERGAFVWGVWGGGYEIYYVKNEGKSEWEGEFCAAPLASELGEQLPLHFSVSKSKSVKDPRWMSRCWWGDAPDPLRPVNKKTEWYQESDKGMADSMAKCWLYLKKNNLLHEEPDAN